MWSNIIMVDLVARQDWCVLFLERVHDLFSVKDFSVHALHLVVIVMPRKRDLSNVNGTVNIPVGSVLLEPCVMVGA